MPFEKLEQIVPRNVTKKAVPDRSKISMQNDYEVSMKIPERAFSRATTTGFGSSSKALGSLASGALLRSD